MLAVDSRPNDTHVERAIHARTRAGPQDCAGGDYARLAVAPEGYALVLRAECASPDAILIDDLDHTRHGADAMDADVGELLCLGCHEPILNQVR